MTTLRWFLLALLFATPLAAQTTPHIEPADPTSAERITLVVSEIDTCPPDPVVTRNGVTITVELGRGPCLSAPMRITYRLDLGTLPAGRYVVFIRDEGQLQDTFTFEVRDANGTVVVRPSLGPTRGGTVVEVLTNAAYCTGTSCAPPVITFGGVPATNVTIVNPTTFRATTPAHAAGAVEVRVAGGNDVRSSFAFRYYDANEAPNDTLFERVLFPVIYNGAGVNGSDWMTELTVRNDSTFAVEPWRAAGTLSAIPAMTPVRLSMGEAPGGVFLYVPRESASALHFGSLVRDLSQQESAWGTELPVVRENDFAPRVNLLNVPNDRRFRKMLRIYGRNEEAMTVRVTFDAMDNGRQMLSRDVTLARGGVTRPAYAALGDEVFNQLPGFGRGAIRVESLTGHPVWAFVTVTNNDTQHVTVISPQ